MAILELSPNLVLYIVDRLFGGKGQASEEARAITNIEQTIMKKIIEKAMETLSTAWQQVVPLTFILEGFESNPDVVQIAPPGETVITISLEIKIQDTSSLMNICFPYLILEDIISKLNVQHFISMSKKEVSEEQAQTINERLRLSSLPIIAFMGRTSITFEDIVELKIGDVIRLNKKIDVLLEITIGGNKKFLGRPGVKGKKKAIKITQSVTDDDIEEHEVI